MKANKFIFLLAVSLFILCIGTRKNFGQYKPKSVGNIKLSIGSKDYSVSIPVNEKYPILQGESFGVDAPHGDSYEVNSFAVADKKNPKLALLKMLFVIYKHRGGTKIIKKQFTLEKNRGKNFRLKYKQFDFEIVALYQSENEQI